MLMSSCHSIINGCDHMWVFKIITHYNKYIINICKYLYRLYIFQIGRNLNLFLASWVFLRKRRDSDCVVMHIIMHINISIIIFHT